MLIKIPFGCVQNTSKSLADELFKNFLMEKLNGLSNEKENNKKYTFALF